MCYNQDQLYIVVKSISGGATAEFNYQSGPTLGEVVGPQLSFDKSQLCMMTPVGITKQDQGMRNHQGLLTITFISHCEKLRVHRHNLRLEESGQR